MKREFDISLFRCFSYRHSFAVYALLTCALLLCGATSAFAISSYTVSPMVMDETVEARDIISKTITIQNTGDQPLTVYPTVNNISLKEGGTIEAFLSPVESDRTTSLASWIEISRLGVDIKIGESKAIPLTLRINPEPVPGTYHAFVGFGTGRNRDVAEQQVAAGLAPGVVLNVTIEEKKNEFMKLSKFIVSRFVTSAENQAAVYTFNNPGDEPLVPKGEIILYDSTGKEVGAVAVNTENIEIPPGGEHVFTASVPTQGLFGKYKAFLSVEYGSTQRGLVQDTSYFYALPLRTILIIVLVIAIAVAAVAWYMHKKYFDEEIDDSDRLMVHVRETQSEAKEHDIHLTKS